MAHTHDHPAPDYSRAFAVGITLNLVYIAFEAIFGMLSGSLALLADAGHNLSDVLGLLLAWGASYMVRRKPTARRTYGWRKSTILAALFNAVILMVAMGAIAWEALNRFTESAHVTGRTIIWVAAIGVVINAVTAMLFAEGRRKDLNIRGAFVHMAADAAVSAGVVAAGIAIIFTGWFWLDPLLSLVIVVIILIGTWGLLRDSLNMALDAVPAHIDAEAVREYLSSLPGVEEVHDLHIWAMSTTEAALTVHLVRCSPEDSDRFISRVHNELYEHFGIGHVTLQLEADPSACRYGDKCKEGSPATHGSPTSAK
jgi:cobalt-zinc-cadmium efflux system protein